jgi:hypothetical protein
MAEETVGGSEWLQKLRDDLDELYARTLTTPPASDAETIAGSIADKAVTPHSLAALTGTSARRGLTQLASNAEAIAGSDTAKALTADDLAAVITKMDIISFAGHNGAGVCTMTGVKVGDVVLSVTGQVAADVGDKSSLFEAAITVNDQIQQSSATDLSTKVYMALILRKS